MNETQREEILTEQKPDLGTQEQPQTVTSLKIGGLLIFIAIGLVLSLLQNSTYLLSTLTFLQGQVWESLTNPASTAFHPYWKTVIIYEFVTASIFVASNLAALILFFQKRRLFPLLVIVSIPVIFILSLVSYYLSGLVPAIAESPDYGKVKELLIIKFVALHVWIPYFLVSKRVKRTFVN